MEANTRGEILGWLARADRAAVRELADTFINSSLRITRAPVTGVVSAQVRDPLAKHRFLVGDVIASEAYVNLDGESGWGMCFGDDRPTALALAICDAVVACGGEGSEKVFQLARDSQQQRTHRRQETWEKLRPTIVEFEEIP